ncbi:hypothetical protein GGS26DRAFT_499925 [Hypomontagnella submonticulosa]|nr:hypothetical protein GGS26DRAFT_499925 [Hypomontagnella submonticulosa]
MAALTSRRTEFLTTNSQVESPIESTADIRFLNTSQVSTSFMDGGWFDSAHPFIQSAYIPTALTPETLHASPADNWNHLRIPMLDSLSPWDPETEGNPWVSVPNDMATESCSAITGLPIAGLPEAATDTTRFSMEPIYFMCNGNDSSTFPSNEPLQVSNYGTLRPGTSLRPGTEGYFSSSGTNVFVGSTNDVITTNPLYPSMFYVSNMTETFGGFGSHCHMVDQEG